MSARLRPGLSRKGIQTLSLGLPSSGKFGSNGSWHSANGDLEHSAMASRSSGRGGLGSSYQDCIRSMSSSVNSANETEVLQTRQAPASLEGVELPSISIARPPIVVEMSESLRKPKVFGFADADGVSQDVDLGHWVLTALHAYEDDCAVDNHVSG